MNLDILPFEQPIVDLEMKIEELRHVESSRQDLDLAEEIKRLQKKLGSLTQSVFSNLTPWQKVQLARHPKRPRTSEIIETLTEDFEPLAGDRAFADDWAIIGGVARFGGRPVVLMGHEKGRKTAEKIKRNFGMPKPEGYRKARRLMRLAERFNMPLITFIDTPGAYAGINAEERGQSEAIAQNLQDMSQLKVPILCTIIGEGGSGGALAIGVGDEIAMMQYSVYSVISPEGCASILWKDAARAPEAAQAMGMLPERLKGLGLIDSIVEEPLGGAHRGFDEMAQNLKTHLQDKLTGLSALSTETLVQRRYERLLSFGALSDEFRTQ